MEPEGICPPYWPELLWWLLHHKHPIPVPDPDPDPWYKPVDEILSALATYTLASRLGNVEIGNAVRKQAGEVLIQKTQELLQS